MENKTNHKLLVELAINAKHKAISPTGYHCGAAVLSDSGKIYTGCNLGSEDGIFNICAEQVAICKMLSEENGASFHQIAVVGGHGDELIYTTPCGVCRQLIAEFGKDIEVICAYEEKDSIVEKVFNIRELLPEGYQM